MRNADWSKYLDQMEQALQSPAEPIPSEPASKPVVVRLDPPVSVAPPRPAKPVEIPVLPRESMRPSSSPVSVGPSYEEPIQRQKVTPPAVPIDTPVRSGPVQAAKLRKRTAEPERDEIAQNSYKGFRETREELLQRLLDPQISLEDAARILNVCPTTVRRYTNRGVLKHIRTAGNQRRFRLSDVLGFMEAQSRGEIVE